MLNGEFLRNWTKNFSLRKIRRKEPPACTAQLHVQRPISARNRSSAALYQSLNSRRDSTMGRTWSLLAQI
jgi:hypothetical protein